MSILTILGKCYPIEEEAKDTPLNGLRCPSCLHEGLFYDPGERSSRVSPGYANLVYCCVCGEEVEDFHFIEEEEV